MSDETKQQKPFPQFIDKNPRKHFHWSLFIVISVAIAAAVLICIQNFKTAEEIDSIAFSAPSSPLRGEDIGKGDFDTWKTYRNEEYGFEVKYPENLKLVFSKKNDGSGGLVLSEVNEAKNIFFILVIRINTDSIDELIDNPNLGKFFNLAIENNMIKIINVSDSGKIFTNPGGVVFKSSASNKVLAPNKDIYFFSSSELYNPNSNIDLFADILSTFKFNE